jgi:hypothetical protein
MTQDEWENLTRKIADMAKVLRAHGVTPKHMEAVCSVMLGNSPEEQAIGKTFVNMLRPKST